MVWDTNVLAAYFSGKLSDDNKLRMDGLVSGLKKKKEPIGIPAQVLAEYLDGVEESEWNEMVGVFKSSAFRFLPFDKKAAVENAILSKKLSPQMRKGTKARPRQAIKVDRQIVAIAKAHNARFLLTEDVDMLAEARRNSVEVKSIADLPISEDDRQQNLALDVSDSEDDSRQTVGKGRGGRLMM